MDLKLHSTAYGWLMLAGIFVSILFWSRLARRDERLLLVYISALAGAFFGAKLIYLGAEGWMHWRDPNRWIILATGKSITGAAIWRWKSPSGCCIIPAPRATGLRSSCPSASCSVASVVI
jgi:hypothetical protein